MPGRRAEREEERTNPEVRGENIYLRGRVLARLREAPPPGVKLPDLARQIGGDTDVEPRRLSEIVEGLERDGLARVAEAPNRPEDHPTGAVAEERAAYVVGPERGDPAETRVSLP